MGGRKWAMVRVCFCSFFTGSCIDTGRLSNVIVLCCCGRLREGFVGTLSNEWFVQPTCLHKTHRLVNQDSDPRSPTNSHSHCRGEPPSESKIVRVLRALLSFSLSPFICDDVHCSGVCVRVCESFIAPRGFGFSCLEVVGRGRVPFILRSFHTGHNTTGPRATSVSGRVLGAAFGWLSSSCFWELGSRFAMPRRVHAFIQCWNAFRCGHGVSKTIDNGDKRTNERELAVVCFFLSVCVLRLPLG